MPEPVADKTQQPLYIAPANPAGKALAERLAAQGYAIAGLADNLKQGDGLINTAQQAKAGAIIVLVPGAFTAQVAAGLLARGFRKQQLWSVDATDQLQRYRLPLRYYWSALRAELLSTVFGALRAVVPRSGYLYYAEGFFDSNVLLCYREHHRQQPEQAWLLGRRLQQQLPELMQDRHFLGRMSLYALWRCLRAKALVVDHEYTGQTFSLLRQHIPVFQLWHGLPYKALSGNAHYPQLCDQAFISSSAWFNQHIFPKIFRAKAYLALGYPRNDAFFQQSEQRDWINAEPLALLREVQQQTGDLMIYAPTYRDWGDNDYPLILAELEQWCAHHHVSFILKFHPFISRKFGDAMGLAEQDSLQALPELPHIYLYPSGKNIYPWLAEAKALITDYSSIAFDFMLADRAIFYYQYDLAQYKSLRGATLIPDELFVMGQVSGNQAELLAQLSDWLQQGEPAHCLTKRHELSALFYQQPATAANHIVAYLLAQCAR